MGILEFHSIEKYRVHLKIRRRLLFVYMPYVSHFFPRGSTDPVGLGLLYGVPLSQSDTPHAVELLWGSDWPVAETLP